MINRVKLFVPQLISTFFYTILTFISIVMVAQDGTINRVVIDAGHGGKDPGAIGKVLKINEKDVALDVSLKLGSYINEQFPEVEVIYTRKDDRFIELHERAGTANRNKADLFISIHANSSTNTTAYGTETFVLGLHRSAANLEVAKRENGVIELEENVEDNYELTPQSAEWNIMLEMMQSAYLDQSIQLASLVEDQFEYRVKRRSRGVKQAGFLVLYKTTMPSILVECGFLSHKDEEAFLATDNGRTYLASGIFRAFKEYKTIVEKGSSITQSVEPKKEENIEFRLQLMASKKEIKKGKLHKEFDDILVESTDNGVYRYLSQAYSSIGEAKNALKKAQFNGYTDAFIVAYQDGERISMDDALSSIN